MGFVSGINICVIYQNLVKILKKEKKRSMNCERQIIGGNKLFPKTPRTYGNELPRITMIDKPVLNEIGRKLLGF